MPSTKKRLWFVLIGLMLLATWLAGRQLSAEAFSDDEVASMIVAGGGPYGPLNPLEVWNRLTERSPDQATGFALILSLWGRLAGWTEFATRSLSLFAGLLALAWVYRAGHDMFSPLVGVIAVLLLTTSVFYIAYMHIARAFMLAALAVALTLWSYWRVMLHPEPADWLPQTGLVLGGIGLFYTHYFSTPLVVAIGLYHLLFAPRSARWWRAVLLFTLAALTFLPEASVFVQGVERNLGLVALHAEAMSPGESVVQLVYYFTNGILNLASPVGIVLAAALIGPVIFLYRGQGIRILRAMNRSVGLLLFSAITLLILILAANHFVPVMTPSRMRYMMPLWPLLALLAALVVVRIAQRWAGGAWILLGAWGLWGFWSSLTPELQYQFDSFTRYPLDQVHEALLQERATSDLLVIDGFWSGSGRTRDFYFGDDLSMKRMLIYPTTTADDLQQAVADELRVWYIAEDQPDAPLVDFEAVLADMFVRCGGGQFPFVTLYARVDAFCPNPEPAMRFGDDITLSGFAPPVITDGMLQIDMAWAIDPQVTPDTYSVGLHVFDAASGAFVAQTDYGLPPPPFAPVRATIDLSDLSPGAYQVRVSVYAWQTGQRLNGADLRSGTTGDQLPLKSFTYTATTP